MDGNNTTPLSRRILARADDAIAAAEKGGPLLPIYMALAFQYVVWAKEVADLERAQTDAARKGG